MRRVYRWRIKLVFFHRQQTSLAIDIAPRSTLAALCLAALYSQAAVLNVWWLTGGSCTLPLLEYWSCNRAPHTRTHTRITPPPTHTPPTHTLTPSRWHFKDTCCCGGWAAFSDDDDHDHDNNYNDNDDNCNSCKEVAMTSGNTLVRNRHFKAVPAFQYAGRRFDMGGGDPRSLQRTPAASSLLVPLFCVPPTTSHYYP